MSVLIKGMDMPKDCNECYLREKNVCPILRCIVEGYYRPSFCPIVEVPTPHGRFVDCETLKDDIAVLLERNEKLIDDWLAYTLDDVIDGTPTIIEAEEE